MPPPPLTMADVTDSPEIAEALIAAMNEIETSATGSAISRQPETAASDADSPESVTESAAGSGPADPPRSRRTQRRRSRKPRSAPRESAKSYHQRNCSICEHPALEFIEQEFLHWHNPADIALAYKIGWRAVYRHAHAMGLFARRDTNLRFALAGIIQRCHNVEPSADSVIRAVRAYTRITPQGEWIDPPTRVVVSYEGRREEPSRVSEIPDVRQSHAPLPTASIGHPSLGHTTIDLPQSAGSRLVDPVVVPSRQ